MEALLQVSLLYGSDCLENACFFLISSIIIAVGELELDGGSLRMQSSDYGPLMLTTATKNTILKKFEEAKSSMLTKVFICGTISIVLITLIARKVYQRRKQDLEARKLKEVLEKSRQQRRAIARTANAQLTDEQRCVVCATNPKEVRFFN